MTRHRPATASWGARLGPLYFALLLVTGGCGGDNLFQGSVGIGPDDGRSPTVIFIAPDSGQRVAVGDSVLVEVRVSDEQGIARVDLAGFAVEGSAQLGTRTEVARFQPKSIDLEDVRPAVRDTVLIRYLFATGDSIPADTVFLVAHAVDFSGNEVTETLRIGIGGPRVQIVTPATGTEVRPGAQLLVRLSAAETANRIQTIRLSGTGQVTIDTLFRFEPARASIDTVASLAIPKDAATGDLRLRAIAHTPRPRPRIWWVMPRSG